MLTMLSSALTAVNNTLFRQDNSTLASLNNTAQSLSQALIQMERDLSESDVYFNSDGEQISADDYWAGKMAQTQPGEVLGKMLIDGFNYLYDKITSLFGQSQSDNPEETILLQSTNPLKACLLETAGKFDNSVTDELNKLSPEEIKTDEKSPNIIFSEEDTHYFNTFLERTNNFGHALYYLNKLHELSFLEDDGDSFILAELKKASILAKESGKPLMILIGELHYQETSALMEKKIMLAAKKMNVNRLFSEVFFGNLEPYMAEIVALNLKILQIPVDYAACPFFEKYMDVKASCDFLSQYFPSNFLQEGIIIDSPENASSEAGMRKRNDGMAHVAIQLNNGENVLALVGGMHVHGLIMNTPLSKHYFIFPINVIDPINSFVYSLFNPGERINFMLNEKEVLQAWKKLSLIATIESMLLTPLNLAIDHPYWTLFLICLVIQRKLNIQRKKSLDQEKQKVDDSLQTSQTAITSTDSSELTLQYRTETKKLGLPSEISDDNSTGYHFRRRRQK